MKKTLQTIRCHHCGEWIDFDFPIPERIHCPACDYWNYPLEAIERLDAAISDLATHLHNLPDGPISDQRDEILKLLANAWDALCEREVEATYPYKLERAEELRWQAPYLKFILERHGRTVGGSERADLHHWVVNLDEQRANIEKFGWRKM